LAKNTDAASQLSPKPTPISSGETEPKIWSLEDRKTAKDEYWINIHEPDCSLEKSNVKSLPTNSYLVEYMVDNSDKTHYDIVIAAKKSDVFNFYWDKLKGGLKDIRYTNGTRNPSMWGNAPVPTKKKRKKSDS
jgi:hypothetical protein